jgi:tRNA (cmo5U34)-methyltransferase
VDSSTKTFSFDTVKDFDSHINLSIPNYGDLQAQIKRLASYFIKDDSYVYDLGCSTGRLLKELYEQYPQACYVGIDKAANMTENSVASPGVAIKQADLRVYDFNNPADLMLSVFTLQFMPIEARQQLLTKVYNGLNKGGALIVSEKLYLSDGYLQDVFTFSYYDFKIQSFGATEIFNKQMSLRKIMRPLTERENILMFHKAGFEVVQPFWQSLLFKAWVCIK